MKPIFSAGFLVLILACSHNKNLAQSKMISPTDSLIQHINSSLGDTEVINPKLKQLQKENDLVISFATLNYAWVKRGSFYVLAQQNKAWNLYRYDTKMPLADKDAAMNVSPIAIEPSEAERIKAMYTEAELWKTTGDNGENFCTGKKDCNINDAETWTISVATRKNIHTTTFYAPEFFEECCPGNQYRKAFGSIGKAMLKLAPQALGTAEK